MLAAGKKQDQPAQHTNQGDPRQKQFGTKLPGDEAQQAEGKHQQPEGGLLERGAPQSLAPLPDEVPGERDDEEPVGVVFVVGPLPDQRRERVGVQPANRASHDKGGSGRPIDRGRKTWVHRLTADATSEEATHTAHRWSPFAHQLEPTPGRASKVNRLTAPAKTIRKPPESSNAAGWLRAFPPRAATVCVIPSFPYASPVPTASTKSINTKITLISSPAT